MASRTTVSVVAPAEVAEAAKRIEVIASPVVKQAATLLVNSPASFQLADALLGRVIDFRKVWAEEVDTFLDPLKDTLNSAKRALDAGKAHRDKVDKPLADTEVQLRIKMGDYKRLEYLETQRLQREQQAETDRLEREATAKREAEAQARTPQMKARLANQAAVLETKAAVAAQPVIAPKAVAANTTTRVTKKVRIKDLKAFVVGAANDKIPLSLVLPDILELTALYRVSPETVVAMPGVEIYEDVVIVRR